MDWSIFFGGGIFILESASYTCTWLFCLVSLLRRFSVGDVNIPFCLQSMSKPLTYALVLDDLGPEVVHDYVGHEPSGTAFNEISLNFASTIIYTCRPASSDPLDLWMKIGWSNLWLPILHIVCCLPAGTWRVKILSHGY